jgi:uncharacterized protein
LDVIEVLAIAGIIALASFVRSAIGFGMGLIAMPLLGLVMDIAVATPMLALSGMAMSIVIVGQDWKKVEWKSLRFLLVGAILGTPIGILLLKQLPPEPIKYLLGAIVILFSLHGLFGRKPLPFRPSRTVELALGFVSGTFASGFNIGGPPLVAYGAIRGWKPSVFRASLQAYFMIAGIVALISHGAAGLWTTTVFWLAAVTLPAMIVGTLLGRWANQRIDPSRFQGLIYVVLLILGALLFVP